MGSRLSKKKRTIRRARGSSSMRVAWAEHARRRSAARRCGRPPAAARRASCPTGNTTGASPSRRRSDGAGPAARDRARPARPGRGSRATAAAPRSPRPRRCAKLAPASARVDRYSASRSSASPAASGRRNARGRQPLDDRARAGLLAGAAGCRAQAASLPSAAGVWVARAAMPSATLAYCSASRLETDWAAASLPKPLPELLGRQRAGRRGGVAQQVADGVVVFEAGQPPQRRRARLDGPVLAGRGDGRPLAARSGTGCHARTHRSRPPGAAGAHAGPHARARRGTRAVHRPDRAPRPSSQG